MTDEIRLLAKLEQWMAEQPRPPGLADVIETRDSELFAAFILKGFRAAAQRAVIGRIDREDASMPADPHASAESAVIRIFNRLARRWVLIESEQLKLLGLQVPADLAALQQKPTEDLPAELIERFAILVDIFISINTLLPAPGRADRWMRRPNKAPVFRGRSAIDVMIDGQLEGIRKVRAYLRAEEVGN
jgi:hypothetical protein